MKNKYWLAFSSIEQLDSKFIKKLYDYFGDIEIAYNASLKELSEIDGLSIKKAETFIKLRTSISPNEIEETVYNKGIKYITIDNEKYPKLLKNISDPPVVLYYKGDLEKCNLEKTLAVVGSRRASYNAKEALDKIISELGNTDICIVSGLAAGIDTQAHLAALNNNLKTIGVIASGLDYYYPTSNKHLYEKIEDGNGAVISEYYPTFEPLKFRFPQRNRIVSGLCYGTLVAEASLKSGALITANLTLDQGRELMCIPGAINNINTEGIYKLLKNGATLVTNGEDILNALNWEIIKDKQLKLTMPELTNNEEKIFQALEIEEKGIDELITITGIGVEDMLTDLTTMELKGIIKQVSGDRYKKL